MDAFPRSRNYENLAPIRRSSPQDRVGVIAFGSDETRKPPSRLPTMDLHHIRNEFVAIIKILIATTPQALVPNLAQLKTSGQTNS